MNDFQQCKLLNKSQRTLAIIASTCRIAALRRAKPGSAYLARIEAHWRKTGLSRRSRRRRRIKPSQAGNQSNQAESNQNQTKSNQKSGSINKTQGPTSNIQRNAKGQCSLPGMWSFSGAWKLEFGFFTLILVPEYLTQYITRTTASTIERSLPLIASHCQPLPTIANHCQPSREMHFKPCSRPKTSNYWTNLQKALPKVPSKNCNFRAQNSQLSTHPTLNPSTLFHTRRTTHDVPIFLSTDV